MQDSFLRHWPFDLNRPHQHKQCVHTKIFIKHTKECRAFYTKQKSLSLRANWEPSISSGTHGTVACKAHQNTKAIILHSLDLLDWEPSNNAEWQITEEACQVPHAWNSCRKVRQLFTRVPRPSRLLLLTRSKLWILCKNNKVGSANRGTKQEKVWNKIHCAWERAYISFHGTEMSGTFMVSIVLRQVCCCKPINILIWGVRLIGQQEFTTLKIGI